MEIKKGFAVVADGARARIFDINYRTGGIRTLQELVNPEQQIAKKELVRRAPGRKMQKAGGLLRGYGTSESQEPIDEVTRRFARLVTETMSQMRKENNFGSAIVAASPKFLGLIREEMDKDTGKLVEKWVNKDLSTLSQSAIATHLGLKKRSRNPNHFLMRDR